MEKSAVPNQIKKTTTGGKAKKIVKVPKAKQPQIPIDAQAFSDIMAQLEMSSSGGGEDIFGKLESLMQKPEMKSVEKEDVAVIHTAFNGNMKCLLEWLKTIVPEEASNYDLLIRILEGEIAKDPSKPMREWRKAVQGHEACLTAFNDANVKEFLRVGPSIEVIGEFNLPKYWNRLSKSEIEKLWTFFIAMQTFAGIEKQIPVKLYQKIEKLVFNLKNNSWKNVTADHIQKNPKGIFQNMAKELLQDKGIIGDIQEFVENQEANQTKIFQPTPGNPTEDLINKFESTSL